MSNSKIVFQDRTPCYGYPPLFGTDDDAIAWSLGQGAFPTRGEAQKAFEELRTTYPAVYVWPTWIRTVGRKIRANSGDW